MSTEGVSWLTYHPYGYAEKLKKHRKAWKTLIALIFSVDQHRTKLSFDLFL